MIGGVISSPGPASRASCHRLKSRMDVFCIWGRTHRRRPFSSLSACQCTGAVKGRVRFWGPRRTPQTDLLSIGIIPGQWLARVWNGRRRLAKGAHGAASWNRAAAQGHTVSYRLGWKGENINRRPSRRQPARTTMLYLAWQGPGWRRSCAAFWRADYTGGVVGARLRQLLALDTGLRIARGSALARRPRPARGDLRSRHRGCAM